MPQPETLRRSRQISNAPLHLKVTVRGEPIELFLFEDDFVSNLIRRDHYWEMPQTRLLGSTIKPGNVVLDIGANLGYYTVLAAKLASDGVVHAFEPDPENFALLARNCELNGCTNVVLHDTALAERSGETTFFRSAHNAGDHRISDGGHHQPAESVRLSTGDQILAGLPRVDVVKCDTQGAEAAVFAGLEATMTRSVPKPLMLVEFEPLGLQTMGYAPSALLDRFDAWGYQYSFVSWENIFTIDRATLLQLARHWLDTGCNGSVDLILLPSR